MIYIPINYHIIYAYKRILLTDSVFSTKNAYHDSLYCILNQPTEKILPMKGKLTFLMAFCAIIGLFLSTAFAETRYVSENFEITMRTGPSSDRKIIALVPSGRALEVLTFGDEWTQVRSSGGKEGWVLSRYLTQEEPCDMVFDRLKQEFDLLNSENTDLKANLDQLLKKGGGLESALSEMQKANDKLSRDYSNLKKESANYISLKEKHKKVVKALALEKEKSGGLETENSKLNRNQNIKWFLSGGGVLFLGIIIGLISKSGRRRSRSSLLH